MANLRIKTVLKAINSPNLNLINNGDGYFYFVMDDGKCFETHSVYVNTLNELSLESWVEIGKFFVNSLNS